MAMPENLTAATLQPAWWMTNEMLAGVSWLGLFLTSAGLILGVIAFWIALFQLRKTKNSAESARLAAESSRTYYSYISSAYVSSQISSLIQTANNKDYTSAQTAFIHVKHLLRMKMTDISINQKPIADVKRSIATVNNQLFLAVGSDPKFNVSALLKSLDKIHEFSSENEADANARSAEIIK